MTQHHNSDSPSQKNKNQERLINQNKKLNEEIRKLQGSMGQLISENAIQTMQNLNTKKKKNQKLQELSTQQSYMKKLKNKLIKMKAVTSYNMIKDIKNQQNHIVSLKKQYEALQIEKDTIHKIFHKKKQALDYNRPLDTIKNKTEEKLSKLRQQNGTLGAEIVNLQRQIRKYHKYQQMNKSYKDQKIVVENPEFQLTKLEHDKKSWQRRAKGVEQKWKPQFDNLDKQFMVMREIVSRKQKIIQQSQKQFRSWQTRASAVRSQSNVISDRQRLSKVVSQNIKKQEKSNDKKVSKDIKNRQNRSSGKINQKKEGVTTNMLRSMRLDNKKQKQQQKSIPIEQKKTERRWNIGDTTQSKTTKFKLDTNSEMGGIKEEKDNEFLISKQNFDKKQKEKNKIITSNVGVGTSFYYNDDQD